MIFNHAGVDWYGDKPSRTTIEGLLTYLGSFAPGAFFLLTGLGVTIACARSWWFGSRRRSRLSVRRLGPDPAMQKQVGSRPHGALS